MIWKLKKFEDLSPFELYEMLKLRSSVFVVEQNCPYLDTDGKDLKSLHLMGYYNNELVAYTRLLPAGVSYAEASIGRVVTHPEYRREGFGVALMKQSISTIYQQFGEQPIRIGAQLYLQKFYESFGFEKVSDVYLEDEIEHIEMLLTI